MMLLDDSGKLTHLSILVIGAPHTGKTTLCETLISGKVPGRPKANQMYFKPYFPSIESCFTMHISSPAGQSFETREELIPLSGQSSSSNASAVTRQQSVIAQIIDGGGYPTLSGLWISQIQAADAFMLVYDVGDKRSLQHLWKFYRLIAEVKQIPLAHLPVVIVGNMIDTVISSQAKASSPSDRREKQVTQDMIQTLSEIIHVPFVETTSRAPSSVLYCFRQLISESQRILKKRLLETPDAFDIALQSEKKPRDDDKAAEEPIRSPRRPITSLFSPLSHSNSVKSSSSASSSAGGSTRFSAASRSFFQGSVTRVKDAVGRMSFMPNIRKSSPPSSLPPIVDSKGRVHPATESDQTHAQISRSLSLGSSANPSRSLRSVQPLAGWNPSLQHPSVDAVNMSRSVRDSTISHMTTSTHSSGSRPAHLSIISTTQNISSAFELSSPKPGSIRYRRDMACRLWRDRTRKCQGQDVSLAADSFNDPVGLKHLVNGNESPKRKSSTESQASSNPALPSRGISLVNTGMIFHRTHLAVARRQISQLLQEVSETVSELS